MSNFVCHVREGLDAKQRRRWHEACEGKAIYEHENEPYCVLHLPRKDKQAKFEQALGSKLARKDYNVRGAYFPHDVKRFKGHEFDADENFAGAIFRGHANFRKTIFRGEADFSRAIFDGEADFRRATFEGSVEFKEPTASWYPSGSERYSFNARVNFSMATFEKRARFIGHRLFDTRQKRVTFRDALIEKPENFSLDGVALRPSWFIDANVQRFRFTNVKWPPLENRRKDAIDAEVDAIGDRRDVNTQDKERRKDLLAVLARTCRELSANAEDNRDYTNANEFHYWSMEAVRKQGWSRSWPIITLYWVLSGYGVRAVRAFWVLFGICVAFAVSYTLLGLPELKNFWTALGYSLGALARLNLIPRPDPATYPVFQFLVIVEGLLGPLQIALLVLAIRRKVMRSGS
jgi:hypothetical protein